MEKMSQREINALLSKKNLLGKVVKVVSYDHFTVTNLGASVRDSKYHHIMRDNAKFVTIGLLIDIQPGYIGIASNWVLVQDEPKIEELHKVLRKEIVQIKPLVEAPLQANN